ncbi:MAG: tRNA dihydrouridine synthase DusB [Syntrophobacteraceae bacterium]
MREDNEPFQPKPLRIGRVLVSPPVILAPMAGVTDKIFRRIMAEHGAGMVTTEMVSAEGLRRDQPVTRKICVRDEDLDIPQAVQIFGHDPFCVAEAARMVEADGASLVDINAGCPVKKIIRQGAGAGLLKDPDRLASIVEETKKSVGIPVTVKVRIGWDECSTDSAKLARRLASAGADAITIHGRTAVQQFRGKSDWSWIQKAKEAVEIPVIGNGDIATPFFANEMFRNTGCDGIMIGRASLGNPWLFSVLATEWGYGNKNDLPSDWTDFYSTVSDHLDRFRAERPVPPGHFRKILIWYSKGCPDACKIRSELTQVDDPVAMIAIFGRWIEGVEAKGTPFLATKVPENGSQVG